MIIALIIVTVSFIFTGINLIFEEADYESCYDKRAIPLQIESAEKCSEYNGTWMQNNYCDFYSECHSKLDIKQDKYRFQVFLSSLIVGIILLISALFIAQAIISTSMMGSGIVTLLIGTLGYWDKLGEVWRFIILGISLAILIWITIKKLK